MNKKTNKSLVCIFSITAAVLAWLSGYFVMYIVYESLVASIIFGSVIAVIVFCESRFSYISLKSDGKITITKEEVKSNLWQIIAATSMALVVSIPIVLKIFGNTILAVSPNAIHDIGLQLRTLINLFTSQWISMALIIIAIVAIYLAPIIIKMTSDEE